MYVWQLFSYSAQFHKGVSVAQGARYRTPNGFCQPSYHAFAVSFIPFHCLWPLNTCSAHLYPRSNRQVWQRWEMALSLWKRAAIGLISYWIGFRISQTIIYLFIDDDHRNIMIFGLDFPIIFPDKVSPLQEEQEHNLLPALNFHSPQQNPTATFWFCLRDHSINYSLVQQLFFNFFDGIG